MSTSRAAASSPVRACGVGEADGARLARPSRRSGVGCKREVRVGWVEGAERAEVEAGCARCARRWGCRDVSGVVAVVQGPTRMCKAFNARG